MGKAEGESLTEGQDFYTLWHIEMSFAYPGFRPLPKLFEHDDRGETK